MLNISHISVARKVKHSSYQSLITVDGKRTSKLFLKVLWSGLALFIVLIFLPWTQNIRSHGNVTALRPDQRPQTIHSIIPGRIEAWHVKEGDFVHKGDTILFISEIKDEYFDPNLLSRTEQQLKSKELSVKSYMEKIRSLDAQIDALVQTSSLKIEQAENMLKQADLSVISDSIDYKATVTNYQIALEQYKRMEQLYKNGLKSLTDLEKRELNVQKTQSQMVAAENKMLTSKNKVINAQIERTSILAQYRDDIAKAESEKYASLSSMYDAEALVTKLQNQYMNYSIRIGMYYITAPQDGYITKTIQTGIGETIKEGDDIVSIMPSKYDLAVEMYIKPMDLPLVQKQDHVRIQFDGWPAIVFSGWPNTSHGTYGGNIVAIDNFISENGMYRLLISPDENDYAWPEAIRVGAGTDNMILLSDVPIWYELWRQINGFPPDYYSSIKTEKNEK